MVTNHRYTSVVQSCRNKRLYIFLNRNILTKYLKIEYYEHQMSSLRLVHNLRFRVILISPIVLLLIGLCENDDA